MTHLIARKAARRPRYLIRRTCPGRWMVHDTQTGSTRVYETWTQAIHWATKPMAVVA